MGEVSLMAIELPAAQKVYTTKYDNFKGVDFTNDSTNIWRRRSPTGVNMLPDASGRPFKRHGWDILLDNETISTYLGVTSCTILKCSYFELAGTDHIVIFTDSGVAFYNGSFSAKELDPDCYRGYDRCFFFEGDGTSAFYIYGNFRVWRYSYDNGFTLEEVTDKLTVPTVLISSSAVLAGTVYEGYNLFGKTASIEYNDTALYTYWCSDGISIIPPSDLKDSLTLGTIYRYTWDADNEVWTDTNSTGTAFSSLNITILGTQVDDDEIIIVYLNGVLLPNNVSSTSGVSVYASTTTQFDTPLEVINAGAVATGEAKLYTDDTKHREKKQAWIEFYDTFTWGVDEEDFIKVNFPSVDVLTTTFTDLQDNGTADLDVEVV